MCACVCVTIGAHHKPHNTCECVSDNTARRNGFRVESRGQRTWLTVPQTTASFRSVCACVCICSRNTVSCVWVFLRSEQYIQEFWFDCALLWCVLLNRIREQQTQTHTTTPIGSVPSNMHEMSNDKSIAIAKGENIHQPDGLLLIKWTPPTSQKTDGIQSAFESTHLAWLFRSPNSVLIGYLKLKN